MKNHPILKIVGILATLLLAQGRANAQPAQMQPENTYAVIVGVLEWESATLPSFSKENRRDQGLHDQLKILGVPEENMVLLLGKDATNANMLKATKEVAQRAAKDSTFIFYYAGHGYPGSKGIYFASFDAGADEQAPEGFLINDVASILKKNYKGERVLLMADCCYSGGLADVAHELSESGFKIASLTSASIANTSTGRWTFTCSIIDVLSGRRLLDLDSDGYIAISEASNDVREAMNFVESQNHGFALHGMGKSFRLSQVSPDEPQTHPIPQPYALRQRMKLRDGRKRPTARIVDFKDGKLKLEIQRYHDRKFVWRAADELSVYEKPNLPVVPSSSQDFPVPLSPEEAGKKATVNGKYSNLLRKISVKFDYLSYGEFSDYGLWNSNTYAEYSDLPTGYWVYVYPNWYIFENKAEQN
jgi:hypothetical protein